MSDRVQAAQADALRRFRREGRQLAPLRWWAVAIRSHPTGRGGLQRPAYEAIQNTGEAEFHRAAVEQAQGQLRDGLPLRASINVVGYLARKPEGAEAE